MYTNITPSKPIEKMTKLELLRFVQTFSPRLFLPKTTKGGRVQVQRMYQEYLNNAISK